MHRISFQDGVDATNSRLVFTEIKTYFLLGVLRTRRTHYQDGEFRTNETSRSLVAHTCTRNDGSYGSWSFVKSETLRDISESTTFSLAPHFVVLWPYKEPCNARLCKGGEFPKESVIDDPFLFNLLPSSDPYKPKPVLYKNITHGSFTHSHWYMIHSFFFFFFSFLVSHSFLSNKFLDNTIYIIFFCLYLL